MSDDRPRDDDPTRAYRPFGNEEDAEATRMERTVPPGDPNAGSGNSEPATAYMGTPVPAEDQYVAVEPEEEKKKPIALFVTLFLLTLLLGLVLGWFLFANSEGTGEEETTTTVPTTQPAPAAAAEPPTTAARRTTTTVERTTTTQEATTTTVPGTTTTTAKP